MMAAWRDLETGAQVTAASCLFSLLHCFLFSTLCPSMFISYAHILPFLFPLSSPLFPISSSFSVQYFSLAPLLFTRRNHSGVLVPWDLVLLPKAQRQLDSRWQEGAGKLTGGGDRMPALCFPTPGHPQWEGAALHPEGSGDHNLSGVSCWVLPLGPSGCLLLCLLEPQST